MAVGVLLNFAISGVLIALSHLFANNILSLFLTDNNVLQLAHRLLMITLWSYLVFGTMNVFTGIMRSSGTVIWPMIFSIISIWGFEIPVAYILARKIGIEGYLDWPTGSSGATGSISG